MTQGLFEVCPTPTGVGVYVRLSALVWDGTRAHRTATTNAELKNLVIVINLPRLSEKRVGDLVHLVQLPRHLRTDSRDFHRL